MERGIKYKPSSEEPFTFKDLYVGASIIINHFTFLLANADEYTFSYMENNKHLFIMGDASAVLKILRAQVDVRYRPVLLFMPISRSSHPKNY